MKTRNIFTLEDMTVRARIVEAPEKGEDAPENPQVFAERVFDAGAIPASLVDGDTMKSLAAYGLSQLLQDRASQMADNVQRKEGLADTLEGMAANRVDSWDDTYSLLVGGNWSQPRARKAGNGGVDTFFASGFAAFLCEQGKDVTVTTATAILEGLSKEERAKLRKDERIAAHVMEARKAAREAADSFDLGDVLGA